MSVRSRKGPVVYTEEDWNVDSIPYVEENGVNSDGGESYRASKTLAEKALWSEYCQPLALISVTS